MPEGITTSMYQPAPQVNPLGVVHEFAGAQAQLNQARTFQMEFSARQALGPMLKASIQPDGSIDTAKLFQMVAAHPATGWKLPELVEGFLKNELTTQEIANKHLANARDQFDNMSRLLGPAYAGSLRKAADQWERDKPGQPYTTEDLHKKASMSLNELTQALSPGIGSGLFNGKTLTSFLMGMPGVGDKTKVGDFNTEHAILDHVRNLAMGSE